MAKATNPGNYALGDANITWNITGGSYSVCSVNVYLQNNNVGSNTFTTGNDNYDFGTMQYGNDTLTLSMAYAPPSPGNNGYLTINNLVLVEKGGTTPQSNVNLIRWDTSGVVHG